MIGTKYPAPLIRALPLLSRQDIETSLHVPNLHQKLPSSDGEETSAVLGEYLDEVVLSI